MNAKLCSTYPLAASPFLNLRLDFKRHFEWLKPALSAAQKSNQAEIESKLLGKLGWAHYSLGEYKQAIEYYHRAITSIHGIENRQIKAEHLSNLARSLRNFLFESQK